MRTRASGDSSPLRAFPRRGVRWLLAFARFSHTGASGDFSPSHAFSHRVIRWLLTFARFSAQGNEVTPLHREGPIPPWMRVSLYTWQPLMCDMRTLSSRICPRLSAPPWKGDVRSRADVLSCRFDGWEECWHSRHKLITRVLKVHHWSRADGLILKKKSYSPERCRGAAIQACPRMSKPQLRAVIVYAII